MYIKNNRNTSKMRKAMLRNSLPIISGLTLLLVPLVATARPGHSPHHRSGAMQCMSAHVREQLPIFDLNKNGKLEPEEHRAMRRAERKADLTNYDLDKDGRLNDEEHKNLRYAKMVQHFEELDTDSNAEISESEAKGSCTPVAHRFGRIDDNGNGSISWTEFEKAAPKGPKGRRHGHRKPRN